MKSSTIWLIVDTSCATYAYSFGFSGEKSASASFAALRAIPEDP